ncbi:hypothetical protein KC19_4G142200 [Ceratodon purpureus]|uniref:NADH dehydrogenase [ubiquinone] 1 alpha subcomplex assembly factor 3 n=1 Tax=Ceratodon purpureus TaxID=3225 RepID=A0A8T0IB31_CERPU|nr:hypothetical protein KC19_4G142200 [Ceratodon purpureus]
MARFGGTVMRGISSRGSWLPRLRRAYGNYEDFDVFAGADTAEKVRINGYDEDRFFANGVEVEGAIICLSRLTLKWTPKSLDEITPDSLAIFELLRPAPEILVLGCGKRMGRVSKELRDYLRSNGIKLEAIDTANATSTFNILNEEGRVVAAAMLPQGT